MGKKRVMEEWREGYVSFFVLCKGVGISRVVCGCGYCHRQWWAITRKQQSAQNSRWWSWGKGEVRLKWVWCQQYHQLQQWSNNQLAIIKGWRRSNNATVQRRMTVVVERGWQRRNKWQLSIGQQQGSEFGIWSGEGGGTTKWVAAAEARHQTCDASFLKDYWGSTPRRSVECHAPPWFCEE